MLSLYCNILALCRNFISIVELSSTSSNGIDPKAKGMLNISIISEFGNYILRITTTYARSQWINVGQIELKQING